MNHSLKIDTSAQSFSEPFTENSTNPFNRRRDGFEGLFVKEVIFVILLVQLGLVGWVGWVRLGLLLGLLLGQFSFSDRVRIGLLGLEWVELHVGFPSPDMYPQPRYWSYLSIIALILKTPSNAWGVCGHAVCQSSGTCGLEGAVPLEMTPKDSST